MYNFTKNTYKKIGVDIHLPRVYCYALIKYQGLFHTEDKQFIERLKSFLFQINTETEFAQMIKINLECLQLMWGTNYHIFHF